MSDYNNEENQEITVEQLVYERYQAWADEVDELRSRHLAEKDELSTEFEALISLLIDCLFCYLTEEHDGLLEKADLICHEPVDQEHIMVIGLKDSGEEVFRVTVNVLELLTGRVNATYNEEDEEIEVYAYFKNAEMFEDDDEEGSIENLKAAMTPQELSEAELAVFDELEEAIEEQHLENEKKR